MAAGDATAEGRIRIVFSDASQTEKRVVAEFATQELDLATDPRQLQIVPMSAGFISEDDLMIMEFMPTAGSGDVATDPTESATHSLVRVPITIKNVRTANKYEKILTSKDFNAAATNYTCTQDVWTAIGTVTVGAQEQIKIGRAIADNSRVRIELKTAA